MQLNANSFFSSKFVKMYKYFWHEITKT